jgi:hypothetical protein
VAELVDAHDSKSCSARSGGSIPSTGTRHPTGCSSVPKMAHEGVPRGTAASENVSRIVSRL